MIEGRVSATTREMAQAIAASLPSLIATAARNATPDLEVLNETLAAMVNLGLARDHGNGTWNWTALGRSTVLALEAEDAQKALTDG